MLRKYAFNNINESEVNNDVFEKAIQNVKSTGLFERILRDKCKYRDFDGFKLIFIYGFNDGASDENNLVVCDANDGHIIFKDPVNDVYRYKGMTDYALVRRYDGRFPQYNLINKDGIIFPDWYDEINGTPTKDGYHIVSDSFHGGYNMIDLDGNLLFDEWKDSIEMIGDFIVMDDGNGYKNIYDVDGKLKVENCTDFEEIEVRFRDPDSYSSHNEYFYKIDVEDSHGQHLYNDKLELLYNKVYDINELSDDSEESQIMDVVSYDYKHNLIAPGGKLLLGDSSTSTNGWADSIEDHPGYNKGHFNLIEINDEYKFFNCKTFKMQFEEGFDKVNFIEREVLGRDDLACVMKDGECNILYTNDEKTDYGYFMFDKPVDNIKMFDDFDFLFVTRDGQDYLVWAEQRLMSVAVEKMYKTEDEHTIIFMTEDGKFDLINTDERKTFCELYMDGERFDACFDFDSLYPLMEYKGKMTFVDAESFRPAFSYGDKKTIRWFDDADIVDEECDGWPKFTVVEDGVKKELDQWGDPFDDEDE